MGKSPSEAKREMIAGKPQMKRKNLHIFYYKKPNGALGLKKEWEKEKEKEEI